MKPKAFYSQECTACGRQVRIRLTDLGRQIGCRHCGCQMTASNGVSCGTAYSQNDMMMERADALLARQNCFDQSHANRGWEKRVTSAMRVHAL